MKDIKKWDLHFLSRAKLASSMSKDPGTKVGAVVSTIDYMDVSTGFNGFARKVIDSCERLNNRDLKLRITLHAEENAILFANKSLEGHQIFTYPFQPCAHCASIIIQKGIIRVVTLSGYPERWEKDFLISKELFKETGVDLVFYDALELID